jgi:uncharacterized protein DUF6886
MRPAPGEVLHFSEDPTITRFEPHVAATAQQPEAYVWPVDASRAMATDVKSSADRLRILGPGGDDRVHAIEYG